MHKLVLISVHAGQLAHVVESIQNSIRELECVDVSQSILDLGINNKFGESQYFSHQVESVSEARLLSLLGGQRLDGLQIKIVIEMKVREVLSVYQEIQHVEALATNLKACFDPVDCGLLKEFGLILRFHKILLVLGFGLLLV
jgi:hypothetical protein